MDIGVDELEEEEDKERHWELFLTRDRKTNTQITATAGSGWWEMATMCHGVLKCTRRRNPV